MATDSQSETVKTNHHRLYWLFLIPAIAVVIPQFFNFREPTLGGFPFFYWYQILWVFLTAGLTYLINRREA
jgi:hypothetical protein